MRVSAESRPPPSVLGTRGQAEPSRALGRAPGCSWTSAQWEPRPRSASGASALSRGRHRRRDGVTAGCTSSPSAARAAVRSGELAATSASVCLSSAGVWPARPASPRGTGGATAPAALGAARGADRGAGPAVGAAPSPLPFSPPAPGSRTAGRRRPRGRHRLLRCSWCPGCRWCCRCCCLSWVPQKLRSIQVTQPSLGRHAAPAGGVRRAAFVPFPPASVAKRATAGVEAPSPPTALWDLAWAGREEGAGEAAFGPAPRGTGGGCRGLAAPAAGLSPCGPGLCVPRESRRALRPLAWRGL